MGPKSDRFTKDIECLMIEMIKQRPLLWDTTVDEYRRTDLKRAHWDEIAQALGSNFTGDMVHKRFQNMESTFRANERKIRESKARCSGKGTDEIYKPKWEYYNMLLFLKRTCAQTDSIDSLSLQNNISLFSQEAMNCSPVSPSCSDVQNSPRITNVYYDENAEQYMLIPSNLSNNTVNTNNSQTSTFEHSKLYISSESNSNPASNATTSARISQCQLTTSDTSSHSPQTDTSLLRPVSAPLNTKHPAENSLYVKRGGAKKSKIMEDIVNTIKDMSQENLPPPKMDEFDMFGAYIASKFRSMTPKDREYYEREILKILAQPTQ